MFQHYIDMTTTAAEKLDTKDTVKAEVWIHCRETMGEFYDVEDGDPYTGIEPMFRAYSTFANISDGPQAAAEKLIAEVNATDEVRRDLTAGDVIVVQTPRRHTTYTITEDGLQTCPKPGAKT